MAMKVMYSILSTEYCTLLKNPSIEDEMLTLYYSGTPFVQYIISKAKITGNVC